MQIKDALSCFYGSMQQYGKHHRKATRSFLYLLDEGHNLYISKIYIVSFHHMCENAGLEILITLSQKMQ